LSRDRPAGRAGVLVDRLRSSLPDSSSDTRTYTIKRGTVAKMKAANIGKGASVPLISEGRDNNPLGVIRGA
jgi:hypothetical protein